MQGLGFIEVYCFGVGVRAVRVRGLGVCITWLVV